jgi:hypothetical protein
MSETTDYTMIPSFSHTPLFSDDDTVPMYVVQD